MKKLMAGLLLALLACVSLYAPAEARWQYGKFEVHWATTIPNSGTSGSQLDSNYVSNAAGVENSAQHADTTSGFSPSMFAPLPTSQALNTDSTHVFNFWFGPSGSSFINDGADTVTVIAQWSVNGTDWNAFIGRGGSALTVLEFGTSNTFALNFWNVSTAAGLTGVGTASIYAAADPSVNMNDCLAVPLVRLIVTGDWTGQFTGLLRGWQWVPDDRYP